MKISKCKNCGKKPEIHEGGDYKFSLDHLEDTCPTKVHVAGDDMDELITCWNECNTMAYKLSCEADMQQNRTLH